MVKGTLHSFFKKHSECQAEPPVQVQTSPPVDPPIDSSAEPQICHIKSPLINSSEINISNLERDPGLRRQIFEYPINQRDEIRRGYITLGPYQPIPPSNKSFRITNGRRFVASWYKLFPNWLEYSLSKDCAFCLPCYLFCNPSERSGSTAFIIEGFRAWKKVHLLKSAQASELESMILNGEIETGKGLNQIGSLQRPADTRWSSHLNSIHSLMKMYTATLNVLRVVINGPGNYIQHAEANKAFDLLTSYNFIFILHLMKEIMEITDDLCQALQRKSQDILNAMSLVSTTKSLLQMLREKGYDPLFEKVQLFCEKYEIQIPNMSDRYRAGRGRARDSITFEHHFRVDIFKATLDSQLTELNCRFKENMVELLVLSSSLDPRNCFSAFDVEAICKLASSFYPGDFSEQEMLHLKVQLDHYGLDVRQHLEFQQLTTISELCQVLARTRKSAIYPLVDRLIRLVLTLPVSTATTERAFSAMKFVKNKLRNKMEDDFLEDYLITYIEKDIAVKIDNDQIINAFYKMKNRRATLE